MDYFFAGEHFPSGAGVGRSLLLHHLQLRPDRVDDRQLELWRQGDRASWQQQRCRSSGEPPIHGVGGGGGGRVEGVLTLRIWVCVWRWKFSIEPMTLYLFITGENGRICAPSVYQTSLQFGINGQFATHQYTKQSLAKICYLMAYQCTNLLKTLHSRQWPGRILWCASLSIVLHCHHTESLSRRDKIKHCYVTYSSKFIDPK